MIRLLFTAAVALGGFVGFSLWAQDPTETPGPSDVAAAFATPESRAEQLEQLRSTASSLLERAAEEAQGAAAALASKVPEPRPPGAEPEPPQPSPSPPASELPQPSPAPPASELPLASEPPAPPPVADVAVAEPAPFREAPLAGEAQISDRARVAETPRRASADAADAEIDQDAWAERIRRMLRVYRSTGSRG